MLACTHDAETDNGPRSAPATERLCIATRTVKPVDEMIRFVVGPDETVVPDLRRRLPGRGVWVTANATAIAEAVKRQAFRRGFKRDVGVGKDLPSLVEQLIERSALDALGIAHKAGRTVIGFARVEGALARQPVVALIQAADAGPEGVRKIAAAARRGTPAGSDVPVIDVFTSAQLDLALGRSNVIHAALLAGAASDGFLARCHSLGRFRTTGPGERA